MFVESISALVIASLSLGQTPVPTTQITPVPAQSVPTAAGRITVPAGTAIQLTLMSAVKSKSTKAGDSVRAIVAFPVTIGTHLAIPAGTFVDGNVAQVTVHPKGGQPPLFRVHFTHLVYSNGYSVALNGENTQAQFLPYQSSTPKNEVAELMPLRLPGARFVMGEGQMTPIAPPYNPGGGGGNPAIFGGIVGGIAAAALIVTLIWAHHRGNKMTDFVLYDAGWQFQMILDSPLTLDAAQVADAANLSTN